MTELGELLSGKPTFEAIAKFCAERYKRIQDVTNNELFGAVYSLDTSENNIYTIKINLLNQRLEFLKTSPIEVLKSAHNESMCLIEREQKIKSIAVLREQYNELLEKLNAWEPSETVYQTIKTFSLKLVNNSLVKDCDISRFYPDANLSLEEWVNNEVKKAEEKIEAIQERINKELEYLDNHRKFYDGLNESLRSISTDTPKQGIHRE